MSQRDLFMKITKGHFTLPRSRPICADAQDLIKKLLVVDPKDRLGCLGEGDLDIREHPWFAGRIDFGKLYRKEIRAPWTPVVKDPFDTSNFARWDDREKGKKDLEPLTHKEQQMFKDF